jgi:cytochrome b6-f complex iron-sulfur subunit
VNPVVLVGVIALVSLTGWAALLARANHANHVMAEAQAGALGRVPAPRRTAEEDTVGVTRRQFLNRVSVGAIVVGLAQFGMASVDYLWPRLKGGFGSKIEVGDADALKQQLAARTPQFVADGRFWLTLFEGSPKAADAVPVYKDANTVATEICALYRKCPHLGCSVPWCDTSKWFECPCHGSKYSINGEYRDGPAPRGMDRFRVDIVGGKVVVDTTTVLEGPPRGTQTSQPAPEGQHCVTI